MPSCGHILFCILVTNAQGYTNDSFLTAKYSAPHYACYSATLIGEHGEMWVFQKDMVYRDTSFHILQYRLTLRLLAFSHMTS